jgi:hypothetical protein
VIGIDLSPVQAPNAPLRCTYYVEDVKQDCNFDHDFDFIRTRILVVGLKSWPNLFRQAYAHLKPGNWIEMQDLVPTDVTVR